MFQNITKANTDDWHSALSAVEASLELEKSVHDSLLALHKNADEQGDAQLTDFLEGEYLKEQVNELGPFYSSDGTYTYCISDFHVSFSYFITPFFPF